MNHHDAGDFAVPDWHERLQVLIAERRTAPFVWGKNDCCMFAADCALAVSGIDLAADVRGTYASGFGAARVLKEIGGVEAAGARAGEEVMPLMACVGDLGLLNEGERALLGVCVGNAWLVPTGAGLGAHPLDAARKAWKVAHG
jgi:hypothetical protein